MRNDKVLVLVESSVMIALAVILDMIKIYHLPNGGSITLGSMVPIMYLAYRRGVIAGMFAGAVFGLIGFIIKPYFLHWAQFFVDYLLAFGILGVVGFWKQNTSNAKVLFAVVLAGTLRFIVHILSGVLFWMEGLELQAAIWGSTTYNATYMIPEIIISAAIMMIIVRRKIDVR